MKNAIERSVDLNAPIEKVWTALTDHKQFGMWFRVDLETPFRTGQVTFGKLTYPGHEGLPFWALVEVIEEPHRFCFIWPVDETVGPDDPELEHKVTRVEFTLQPDGKRTKLKLRESGFENLPRDKRLQAFRNNQGGWDAQMQNIQTYVE
jgi:uncharacterized protein YndB with AHSA1/START domain